MLQKFLMIGVGGSGGKTLRYAWRELDRRLRRAEWNQGMPLGWQFLHIDVPQIVDVISGDVPADVGENFRYLGLAEAPQDYAYYDRKLTARSETLPAVAGWRADPTRDYANPYLGAGQRRLVGRVVTLAELDAVKDAMLDGISSLQSIEADEQMAELGQHLGADPNLQQAEDATVIIVSSMGGGSGSGAFLDVIEVLRSNADQGAQWADAGLVTVLYSADVFYDLPPSAREGIEPNTLAALSELLAATEHEDLVDGAEQSLMAPGLGNQRIVGRRAGRHTLIVGTRNNKVKLASSSDVFRSVGKLLATLVIDERIQHEVKTYLDTNAQGFPCELSFPFARYGHCSSLGYANVGLGRNLFAEYVTERLAKRSLERLLRGFREGVRDAHLRSDKSMIEERALAAKEDFFDASGLWEVGVEHNQVLDKLRDSAEIDSMVREAVSRVREFFKGQRDKEERGRVKVGIEAQFNTHGAAFERAAAERLAVSTAKWSVDIQQQVLQATADVVGRHGLDVAISLLVALNEQALEAASDLRRERDRFLAEIGSAEASFNGLFQKLKERIGIQSADFEKGIGERTKVVQRRFAADVRASAAQLLEQVSSGLLEGLQQALRTLRVSLATQERDKQYGPKIRQWATGAVPAHLRAAPNELLLDKQDEAPSKLAELFDSLAEGDGEVAGESLAIREIIARCWPSQMLDVAEAPRQKLIRESRRWVPSDVQRARGQLGTRSRETATFAIELDPGTLERDARRWVHDRRGAVSGYVGETLRQWLSVEREGYAENAATFAARFDLALSLGAPLISIDNDVHNAVHGDRPSAPRAIVSEIPIGPDHPAAHTCMAAMIAAGLSTVDAQARFNENSDAGEVEIMSFLAHYVHPIVFDSVTSPIDAQWRSCASQPQRTRFWDFRRSRSLPSFIPLSQSRQAALVRGWLVAEVLGYVPRLDGAWSERPFTIWSPRGVRTFPTWLLGRDVTDHGSVLPAVLESLPLAFLGYDGKREDDGLMAYARLIELGSSPGGIGDGTRANVELERWARMGEPTAAQPGFEPAPTPRVGDPEDTIDERVAALEAVFSAYEQSYRTDIGGKQVTPETTLTLGRAWEAHQLISSAARQLGRSTHAITVGGDEHEGGETIPVPRA